MSPRPRFTRLEPDRQRRILDAALDEFVQHGFEEASLNRIIQAAGISKGAMYYYFDDKADLFVTIFTQVMSDVMQQLDTDVERLDRDSFWPHLRDLTRRGTEMMQRDPKLLALGRVYYALPAEMRNQGPLADSLHDMMGWALRLITHGQKLGLVRTDLPVDVLLELMVAVDQVLDRWLIAHYEEMSQAELLRAAETSLALHRRLLEPPFDPSENGSAS